MLVTDNKEKGRVGVSLAIAYYGANGYTINIPLNDTQWYDLVLEKEGLFYTVQCKCTTSETRDVELRTKSGNKISYNIHTHKNDFLFCVDGIDNILYSIPLKDLTNNIRAIKLRTKENYHSGFPSYKYIVTI